MSDDALARAYHELTMLVASTPQLLDFAGWPYAAPAQKPATRIAATTILRDYADGASARTARMHQALRAVADHVDWQQTYTEAEVGADFLARYGWFELVGPTGHFHATDVRAYIAYWGAGLQYDWHLHEAEELYFIIAGHAQFEAEGLPATMLYPGDIRVHGANQPHAMTTTDSPVLALVLWRGEGIDGIPRMGRA